MRRIAPEQVEDLDLSRWTLAFTGAEPVRQRTLERFADAFAGCGFRREAFYPCYGLAEATLIVSGGRRYDPPPVRSVSARGLEQGRVEAPTGERDRRFVVGCGRSISGQRVVVVDPERRARLGPGRVGEIWISGPSIADGYWNHPEESQRTFGSRTRTPAPSCAAAIWAS